MVRKYLRTSILIIIIITMIIFSSVVFAEGNFPSPTPEFFINDFANVLDQSTRDKIQSLGKQLEDKTTAQVVVVTINTLDGQDVESYANELFAKWGIGQEGKDNGILVLNAVKERILRIEVGYGLEGALSDTKTAEIRNNDMNPYLKNNDYNNGILKGYVAIVDEVAQEYDVTINAGSQSRSTGNSSPLPSRARNNTIYTILFVLFFVFDGIFFRFRISHMLLKLFIFSRFFGGGRGGRGGWGGGGGGGSSGGGGRSGGGGSSGGY